MQTNFIKAYIQKKIELFYKSDLLKSGGVYTLSSIFEKAIPFLLLPVLTRYLSTEDYGIVSMFTVLIGLTIPFTGFNIHSAILRSYFKKDIDLPAYIANALFILVGSTAVVSAIFIIFSNLISKYSEFPQNWLKYVILVSAAQFIVNITLVVWQAQKKPFQYGIFKVLLSALNMGLAVILIVGLSYGWEGRVIGKVIAVVLFAIIGLSILWHNNLLKFEIVKEYLHHAFSYGAPLIPHVLSAFIITMIDRVFITNMVGIGETGVYTVGYQIGMIISVLSSSFNKAWTPWFFERLTKGNQLVKKKIVRFTYVYFFIILCVALVLSLIAPWFMKYFVGKSFYSATNYVVWIAIGYSFNGMYLMVTNYVFFEEKTHLLSWMTFVAALSNIVLNYFLIKGFGAIGAAQATTITYLFLFLFVWILSSRIHPMPWFSALKRNPT